MSSVCKFEVDLKWYIESSLMEEHGAKLEKMDEVARGRYFAERAAAMFETRKESDLFAQFYLP